MTERYDAIVVGLGAMGSAALYQLAKRNLKVLGIDQFKPPHNLGSSHGETRITRLANGEGSELTPLAKRSLTIWKDVESRSRFKNLYTKTGLLIVSSEKRKANLHVNNFFDTTVQAAKSYDIKHQILCSAEVKERFPLLKIRPDEKGYFEEEAGFLNPEKCIEANLELAQEHGAKLNFYEKVLELDKESPVKLNSDKNTYLAQRAIITAGAWINEMVPQLSRYFRVYRQILNWFDVEEAYEHYRVGNFPVFIWEPQNSSFGIYGFPAIDGKNGGIKIANEIFDHSINSPDLLKRETDSDEQSRIYNASIEPLFEGISSKRIKSAVCMYTCTEDSRFVFDYHPDNQNILIGSPCSGHGFKHSAAIGEALAEMCIDGSSKISLKSFSLDRFNR